MARGPGATPPADGPKWLEPAGRAERSVVGDSPSGAVLAVLATPRASVTAFDRLEGDAVRVRVAAPPVDGAANAALLRFLAEALGVPRSSVRLAAGAASRRKRVLFAGMTADELRHLLEARVGTG
jgi:uncharacterized protein (TIGR00251 family)